MVAGQGGYIMQNYLLTVMERRIKELPKPPKNLGEQPKWIIPSDGIPRIINSFFGTEKNIIMKIVCTYPSGWDNTPIYASVNLNSIRFSLKTIDDALMEKLHKQVNALLTHSC